MLGESVTQLNLPTSVRIFSQPVGVAPEAQAIDMRTYSLHSTVVPPETVQKRYDPIGKIFVCNDETTLAEIGGKCILTQTTF